MPDAYSMPQPGFTMDRAKSYDERVRKHIPGYEVIHTLSDVLFSLELPENASLLAVGAGTCTELIQWGLKHPRWTFLATDTAPAMLTLAEEKLKAAAMEHRVRRYVGEIQEAPQEKFDAAALILVLHFVQASQKVAMLKAIANRLKPGAPFLIATLFGNPDSQEFKQLNAGRKAWTIDKGIDPAAAEQFCDPSRSDMHIVPEAQLLDFLHQAGFTHVQRMYQASAVGLWMARRA